MKFCRSEKRRFILIEMQKNVRELPSDLAAFPHEMPPYSFLKIVFDVFWDTSRFKPQVHFGHIAHEMFSKGFF
jgi:hypothetical protein